MLSTTGHSAPSGWKKEVVMRARMCAGLLTRGLLKFVFFFTTARAQRGNPSARCTFSITHFDAVKYGLFVRRRRVLVTARFSAGV